MRICAKLFLVVVDETVVVVGAGPVSKTINTDFNLRGLFFTALLLHFYRNLRKII